MWRVRQDGTTWSVIDRAGKVVSSGHGTYQAAVNAIPRSVFTSMATAFAPVAPMPDMPAPAEGAAPTSTARRWSADAAFTDQWTSDGRRLTGEGRVRPFPLPLMWQDETEFEHFGAELIGWIDTATLDGGTWHMAGGLDSSDSAMDAIAALEGRGCFGVSIDVGDADASELCIEVDADNVCTEWGLDFTEYELMGLTATPFPAFQNARMWLDDMGAPAAVEPAPQPTVIDNPAQEELEGLLDLLLASGSLAAPPAAWFDDPQLADDHPLMVYNAEGCALGVPLQITDDGRVFGHIATWSTCHIGYRDECVAPPSSPSSYAYFRTGYVQTAEGTSVPTGVLTMGTGHAPLHMNAREAAAHYDDSGTAWAQVAAGEDSIGVWVAGALLPGVTDEQVRLARALSPSGDWRSIGGNLELVATLSVNVPGFPVQRGLAASGMVEAPVHARAAFHRAIDGRAAALVASGMVPRRGVDPIEARMTEFEHRLSVLDHRTRPLLASAQQAVVDRVRRRS